MFDTTLLDSSPAHAAVLDFRHWVGAFLVGALGSGAAYLVLPSAFVPAHNALIAESLLIGIGVMFYELMLWYVLADARHLGFSVWKWSIVLLLLNVVGFVVYLIYCAVKTGDWRRAALPLAYILEGTCVVALLVVPLIYTQALPDSRWKLAFIPSPPSAARAATPRVRIARGTAPHAAITVPSIIPAHITRFKEDRDTAEIAAPEIALVPGGLPGGFGSDVGLIPFGATTGRGEVPPPPVPAKPRQSVRIHVGGMVEQAKLIFRPSPDYPPLAKLARIQGAVRLEAVIGKDGTIQDLKTVSGHPLLAKAAMDVVARWRYQPTLLNGVPVEVVTEVEVNFVLGE